MLKKSLIRFPNILTILSLVIVVSLIQYIMLKPVLSIGFWDDDWGAVLSFHSLMPNPLSKLGYAWTTLGIHHTMQNYYIGTLFEFLKFDYPLYNVANIFFKTIATLSIFPLVILIFKRKSLAILTTIIHAITYSSTSALTYVLQGVYYIGITLMNIFFIFYYLAVTKNSKLHLILASISLVLAYWFAPGRIYPILAFILLIELFLNFKFGFKKILGNSLVRLALFSLPIIILMLTGKNDATPLGSPSSTLERLANGNWHLILEPFVGIGYLFFPGDLINFGFLDIKNFREYLNFLEKYFLTLLPIILILATILSKNIIKFSLLILLLNFLVSIPFFFIVTHYLTIPPNLVSAHDQAVFWVQQLHGLFGIFILIFSGICLWEWKRGGGKSTSLLALAVGPIFALIFLYGMWIILGTLSLYGGISRYFPFASLGISFFEAAIIILALDWIKYKNVLIRVTTYFFILLFLIYIFSISSKEIHKGFVAVNIKNAYLNREFQENFMSQLDKDKIAAKDNVLFYFDLPNGVDKNHFENAFRLYDFSTWMFLRLGVTEKRCLGSIDDEEKLRQTIHIQNGKGVLFHKNSVCINKWDDATSFAQRGKDTIYRPEDFYAFRVEGSKFINVTDEILQKFQFK